jgi:invasion protein IalB
MTVPNDRACASVALRLRRFALLAVTLCPFAAGAQPKPPAKPATKPLDAPTVVAPAPAPSIPAGPQKVNGASPAWTVTCVSHARAVPVDCALEQRLFAKETGQLLSVAVVSVPGANRQPTLVLQLPTGLALQDGVSVTIDDGPARPAVLQSCDGRGCFASLAIAPDLLEAMRAGKVMTVRAVSSAHETLAFPHMLTDFGTAYDAAK